MIVFKRDDAELGPVEWAKKTYLKTLGMTFEDEFNYNMRLFRIDVGGRIPLHKHNKIFHLQYILKGKMKVTIGQEEHVVEAGDVIYIPSRVVHEYINIGDEPVEFICVTPLWEDETIIMERRF